jgi:sulfur carrier protein ThiS
MKVTIEALGALRKYLPEGERSITAELPDGSTVGDALVSMGAPPEIQYNASIKGQLVYTDTVLDNGDRLLLFTPIEGGQDYRK